MTSIETTHPMAQYSYVQRNLCAESKRDYISVRWRAWLPARSKRDDDIPYKVSQEFAVMIAMSASAVSADVKRVRVSMTMWSAPTEEDNDNMTEVGAVIDENNEAVLERGKPVSFKFRNLRARCCGNPRCRKRREIPFVIAAELDPGQRDGFSAVRYLFLPGIPTVFMHVTQLQSMSVAPGKLKRYLDECPGYFPNVPEPMAAASERHAADLERRAAKRRRRQAEQQAAPEPEPAPAPEAASEAAPEAAPPRGVHPRWHEVAAAARSASAAINELMVRGRGTAQERAIALARLTLADEALDLVQNHTASNEEVERVLRRMEAEAARAASAADDQLREPAAGTEDEGGEEGEEDGEEEEDPACERE